MDSLKISDKLFNITREKNIPLICTFELTRRCNLKCRHCYIDHKNTGKLVPDELTTLQIKNILKQLAKAGTLNLVFTGGEIFLRPDLIELSAFARDLSFDLRLFSNGTFISASDADKISHIGVSGVEVSLYGKEKTHDYITGVFGSFTKTLKTIKLLIKSGVSVTIKSPLMTLNFKDLNWLKSLSKTLSAKLKVDSVIAPMDNGGKDILKYRLTTRQLKKFYGDEYFSDSEILNKPEENLFCSAGRNLTFVGYEGTVYPCIQTLIPLGNLKEKSFKSIWSGRSKPVSNYRKIEPSDLKLCSSCDLSAICQRCPGLALLEDGDLYGPSSISCKIAGIITRKSGVSKVILSKSLKSN